MKFTTKMILFGTGTLSLGIFIGYKAFQKIMLLMVNDKDFMSRKIIPSIETIVGKDKLERIIKIYLEDEDQAATT